MFTFTSRGGSGGIMRVFINFVQYMSVVLAFETEWSDLLTTLRSILNSLDLGFLNIRFYHPFLHDRPWHATKLGF